MHLRLKAEIWALAHIRRCNAMGLDAFLRHRGAAVGGGILLKINRFDAGCELLEPMTDLDGTRVWMRLGGEDGLSDESAEAKIARRLASDPDLWVIEIEDREGRHRLDEPIR